MSRRALEIKCNIASYGHLLSNSATYHEKLKGIFPLQLPRGIGASHRFYFVCSDKTIVHSNADI